MYLESNLVENRAKMLRSVREFFHQRSVLEVDTSHLIPFAQIDSYIDPIETSHGFLHTSPEFEMKKILAKVPKDLYQISHVFRANEKGEKHLTEFTMIEWYRLGFSLEELIEEAFTLCKEFLGPLSIEIQDYEELWSRYVPKDKDEPQEIFFDEYLAPHLGKGKITALCDFPEDQAALAKTMNGKAKRFELFYEGMELANGFLELTDGKKLKERFEKVNRLREKEGKKAFALDEHFLACINDLPECVGVSVGFDRLLMLQQKTATIQEISLGSITGSFNESLAQ